METSPHYFSIADIKEMYETLHQCFGFNYNHISNELIEVFVKRFVSSSDQELHQLTQNRKEDGEVNAIEIALSCEGNIKFELSTVYAQTTAPLLDCLLQKYLPDDRLQANMLRFMGALYYRNKDYQYNLGPNWSKYKYEKYWHKVRPDMLRLYLAIMEPASKLSHQDTTEIKISFHGNKAVSIRNEDGWLEQTMLNYLHIYLGIDNAAAAQKELETVYAKKIGPKMKDKTLSLFLWGTYHLLQESSLKSAKKGSVTNKQCKFIEHYLRILGIIQPDDQNIDVANLRGRLNYLLKSYDTIPLLVDNREYCISPNNKGNTRLW